MTFTSGDPDAVYPSTSVRNDETSSSTSQIIPPYLSHDWQLMRSHLRLAAAHATAAAEASTLEDVRVNGAAASINLMDADFIRRQIQRKETTNAEAEGHADRD